MYNFVIYRVALLNKAKEEQVLSRFNGETDFLKICNQFYSAYQKRNAVYFDKQGKKRAFSITSNIECNDKERSVFAYLDSAYSGESLEIRSPLNRLNYSVSKEELQSRKVFSCIHIPEGSKFGYIVFESKANHGVKVIFERQLQKFLNESGFQDFRVQITPGLNFNHLSNMIDKGTLKKVRLINYKYTEGSQYSLWNVKSGNQHTEEWKSTSKTNNDVTKHELGHLFFSNVNKIEKISFLDEYLVDEIAFEICHNGSSKTFYIKDKSKMRSNIDVSKRLSFEGGQPTYLSLKRAALDLIDEMLDNNRLSLSEAA
ncbi:hypothetical protein [Olleya sp. HaHaR_3_96]|uniref:hypothetical protein n=1 Tax=Olleya sp. HaHaR_3_96 TaxID=2745560 RepID=UPI001C4EC62E|nr:hypothetical protein [Olleya sp. HaHaR_3_96]QXP61000.1 hypothetical protein H0I26_05025 [Olleya sp. HaHaR_3_96]